MDGDRSSERRNGRGVKVEWDILVLPGEHGRGNFGLAEKVEHELGLGEELVLQEVWECSGHTCENR